MALALGCSLADVDVMDAKEFAEWRAYLEIEPPGTHGMELLLAQVCQFIAASAGAEVGEILDLMPYHSRIRKMLQPPQSEADQIAALRGLARG